MPEAFGALVTALEANENVPKMEIVTERLLLHAERKHKEKTGADLGEPKVLVQQQRVDVKPIRCPKCGKLGHIRRFCRSYSRDYKSKQKASTAERKAVEDSSDSESAG